MEPVPNCFTCGNDLKNNPQTNWDKYYKLFDASLDDAENNGSDTQDEKVVMFLKGKILDNLGYNRMCCRRIFLGDPRELRDIPQPYFENSVPEEIYFQSIMTYGEGLIFCIVGEYLGITTIQQLRQYHSSPVYKKGIQKKFYLPSKTLYRQNKKMSRRGYLR